MGFLLGVIGFFMKPIIWVLIIVGTLSFVGTLFVAVIQVLVWIFSDLNGYSIAQLTGVENQVMNGRGEWFTKNSLYSVPSEMLLEQRSHLVMILLVIGGGFVGFIISAIGFGIDQAIKIKKTKIQMNKMLMCLKDGNVEPVDRWVVSNLNRTKSVKRAVGEVSGQTVYSYQDENAISGNLRSVLLDIKAYINNNNNSAAISVMEQWLTNPSL